MGKNPHTVEVVDGIRVRVSQRAPNRCTDCALRRVKCTKEIPCGPCIRRGKADSCRREPVLVQGHLMGGPLPVAGKRPWGEDDDGPRASRAIKRVVSSLADDRIDIAEADLSAVGLSGAAGRGFSGGALEVCALADSVFAARRAGPCPRRAAPEDCPWARAPGREPLTVSPHLASIPVETSEALVEVSRYSTSLHAAVHFPTFFAEHQAFIAALRRGETLFRHECLALYFAVVATGAYFMNDVGCTETGMSLADVVTYGQIWFNAALDSLTASDFLSTHTLEAVQAICILTLSAHAYGPSNRMFTLHACAIHIAQSLQLHLLERERDLGAPSRGRIRREVGRRVWAFLLNQQRLSPQSQQPGALFLPRGRCAPPLNIDDEDLSDTAPVRPRPLSQMTQMTNNIGKIRIADIMTAFHSQFFLASSLAEQERIVHETDDALLGLFDEFPALRCPPSLDYTERPDVTLRSRANYIWAYRIWAYHLWALIVPHRRIVIHRAFMARSFKDKRFTRSREICVAAARDIIRERCRPIYPGFDKPWHVPADTITAGIILAINLGHFSTSEPSYQSHRDEVIGVVYLLKNGPVQNGIVKRGISILDSMLGEIDKAVAANIITRSSHTSLGISTPPEDSHFLRGSGHLLLDVTSHAKELTAVTSGEGLEEGPSDEKDEPRQAKAREGAKEDQGVPNGGANGNGATGEHATRDGSHAPLVNEGGPGLVASTPYAPAPTAASAAASTVASPTFPTSPAAPSPRPPANDFPTFNDDLYGDSFRFAFPMPGDPNSFWNDHLGDSFAPGSPSLADVNPGSSNVVFDNFDLTQFLSSIQE